MADYTDEKTPKTDDPDEAILQELREFYDYDTVQWADIRAQAAIDVKYSCNDTWDQADSDRRGNRPMLNLDQLSQYRNQVENTIRQNKRAVKVSQAGGGATEKTAELHANRIREIEYQSHAQEAYSQAFSDCLTRSYGFARIVAEYEDEDSDNQVFRVKSVANPDQVLPDSDAQSTSGRDWTRCFFIDTMSHKQFLRAYPDATIRNFDADTLKRAGKWMTATRVTVVEYWKVTETPNPKGKGRPKREVCMYLSNGIELLAKAGEPKKHPWKGKYIPFAACFGRIVYKTTGADGESEKMMLSYIRFARDSAKAYNWAKSTLLEKIALPVKASLIGYKGQADVDTLANIERATTEHVPWLEFTPVLEATGQAVLPLPQYGTREPDIQADIIAAEGFQKDIQNALGHYNAQDARMGSTKVTSGVALQELKRSGDLGSYDFLDHYDDFLKFVGEQYDDLLQHYDDTEKEVAVRQPDGTPQMVTINKMSARDPQGNQAYGPKDNPMTLGRHTITIASGPSFDSQREAGKDAAMNLLQNQMAFPIIAADAVRLMDLGAIGDQMALDLEFLQPPAMQQARQQAKSGEAPDPRQLQQELAKVKEQLQQLEGVAKQMDEEAKSKKAELASKEKIAIMEAQLKLRMQAEQADVVADMQLALQMLRNAGAISVAHIAAASKGAAIDAHAAEEQQALGFAAAQYDLDRESEVAATAQAQQHEAAMAAAGAGDAADEAEQQRQFGMEQGDVAHEQALEQGDVSHQQQLELGQQAADLAPVPEPAEGAD